MKLKPFLLVFVSFVALTACQKESSTLTLDSNWADITLQEKGVGNSHAGNRSGASLDRLESYREAKIDLYKKLETDIMNLKIDVRRDVRSFVGDNQKLKEKISAFLKATRIREAVYTPHQGMELSGELYLGESFKSILGLMEKKAPEEKGSPRPQSNPAPGSGF